MWNEIKTNVSIDLRSVLRKKVRKLKNPSIMYSKNASRTISKRLSIFFSSTDMKLKPWASKNPSRRRGGRPFLNRQSKQLPKSVWKIFLFRLFVPQRIELRTFRRTVKRNATKAERLLSRRGHYYGDPQSLTLSSQNIRIMIFDWVFFQHIWWVCVFSKFRLFSKSF